MSAACQHDAMVENCQELEFPMRRLQMGLNISIKLVTSDLEHFPSFPDKKFITWFFIECSWKGGLQCCRESRAQSSYKGKGIFWRLVLELQKLVWIINHIPPFPLSNFTWKELQSSFMIILNCWKENGNCRGFEAWHTCSINRRTECNFRWVDAEGPTTCSWMFYLNVSQSIAGLYLPTSTTWYCMGDPAFEMY